MAMRKTGAALEQKEITNIYGHVSEAIACFSRIFVDIMGYPWADHDNPPVRTWLIGSTWQWKFIGQDAITTSDEDA
jgi:hypothetical protein